MKPPDGVGWFVMTMLARRQLRPSLLPVGAVSMTIERLPPGFSADPRGSTSSHFLCEEMSVPLFQQSAGTFRGRATSKRPQLLAGWIGIPLHFSGAEQGQGGSPAAAYVSVVHAFCPVVRALFALMKIRCELSSSM